MRRASDISFSLLILRGYTEYALCNSDWPGFGNLLEVGGLSYRLPRSCTLYLFPSPMLTISLMHDTASHTQQAKAHIDNAIIRGEKLFSVAQAVILICFYSYTSARFVEVWLYCGLATRISSPLGLNHLESLLDDLPNKMFGYGNTYGGGTMRGQPMADPDKNGKDEENGLGEDILSPNRDRGMGYAPVTEEEKQEQ